LFTDAQVRAWSAVTDAVHRVCHKGLSVDEAMALLLGRRTKLE